MKFRVLVLVGALTLLLGCPEEFFGLVHRTLPHDGQSRTYELFIPDSENGALAPLVVVLHGFTQTGVAAAWLTNFQELGAREGFFVAYPNGLRRRFNFGAFDSPDDVGFIRSVVADIRADFPIDPSRVYLTGASNGGFMTHLMACEAADVFAAVAPVMSSMTTDILEDCVPSVPMPMLIVHGTADIIVPFDGSEGGAPTDRLFTILPVRDTVDFWVEANNLVGPPDIRPVPDSDPKDGTTTTIERYEGDDEVLFYVVEGGGHTWPGTSFPRLEPLVGATSKDFDATEVIWEFFSRHARAAN